MMIPNAPQEYEHRNSVVVPLAFFDKLMKCYYGTGPRDGESIYDFKPENPSSELVTDISDLKETTIELMSPKGFEPMGVAAKKQKAKDGIRHDKTTKEQTRSSNGN